MPCLKTNNDMHPNENKVDMNSNDMNSNENTNSNQNEVANNKMSLAENDE